MCALKSRSNSLHSDVAYAYWNDICDIEPLSFEEQKRLINLIKLGDTSAQNTFVEGFLRLVVSRANKYCHNFDSFMDMVQEGNLGLIAAVKHFDPDKGCQFSTYAIPWIDKYIRRESCRTKKPLYIPEHMRSTINRLIITKAEFMQINNRQPSVEELADIMHMTVPETTELLLLLEPAVSLDGENETSASGSQPLINFVSDAATPSPEDVVLAKDVKTALEDIMDQHLTETEALIMKLRFGFYSDGAQITLREVSEKSGVSIEGVRKIEARAVQKLQNVITKAGLTRADFV